MSIEAQVQALEQAVTKLQGEVAALEAENAKLKAAPGPAGCPNGGAALQQGMAWDTCLSEPQPLDSGVTWTRRQPANDATGGYVRAILSLLSEGQGKNSYPWPLYVQVRASPAHNADMGSANAFAVNARLINAGAGFGAAVFSDVQHNGNGTNIGFDFELIRSSEAGRVIGLNVLNAGDPSNMPDTTKSGDQAINIQTKVPDKGWDTAIRLEPNAASGRAGHCGIWIEGKYDIGLDMENNNIKLNRGAKIFFDENQTLFLWLNPSNSRLEFRYLDNVLGYLKLGTTEHEL